ncbi:putative motility protein [Rhodoferax sp.]|uniref:putative motility protein n=1 Tax=Rhodoferax sp. TaxID=50421 RepID=UPI0025F00AAA|nr:putative motility protein [Rhodoferax sp.]
MNIASTAAVQSATADAQAPASDSLNIRVLKKALDAQAMAAQALIESIPQPAAAPTLATSGSLGTQLNTYA